MKNNINFPTFFVDKPSFFSFIKVLRILIREKIFFEKKEIYFIENTNFNFYKSIFPIFNFIKVDNFIIKSKEEDFDKLRNSEGTNIGWVIQNHHSNKFIKQCLEHYSKINKFKKHEEGFKNYLSRTLGSLRWAFQKKDINMILLKFHELNIYNKNKVKFYINEKYVFGKIFENYAKKLDIFYEEYIDFKFLYNYFLKDFKNIIKIFLYYFHLISHKKPQLNPSFQQNIKPKIAIDISLPIYRPNIFINNSQLSNDTSIYVNDGGFLDEDNYKVIKEKKINFVLIIKKSLFKKNTENIPAYSPAFKPVFNLSFFTSLENKLIENHYSDYISMKHTWKNFFLEFNIKTYLNDSFFYQSIPAIEAIKQIGGSSISFQTSFWEFPPPHAHIFTDYFFSISTKNSQVHLENNSKFKYFIKAGYMKDYTFKNLKNKADELRNKIISNGAKKIIGYLDQGSYPHHWANPHCYARKGPIFLFNKLIENPWMGLIIKPKKPIRFKEKLGEKNLPLLQKAIDTGRLYITLESAKGHYKNFVDSPALVSMVSDICIHDGMFASTAGLESYLSGTRTVIYDNMGFHESIFMNEDNKNLIGFSNFNKIWELFIKHFDKPIKGLGDWSRIIKYFDPYQDEKSSERLTYLIKLLLKYHDTKLSQSEVLEKSFIDYSSKWGTHNAFKS